MVVPITEKNRSRTIILEGRLKYRNTTIFANAKRMNRVLYLILYRIFLVTMGFLIDLVRNSGPLALGRAGHGDLVR